jgi:galactosylxylosylprotein 3-beta-galactosyltransferase
MLLRSTYLSDLPLDVKVFFALGTRGLDPTLYGSLHAEQASHGDLLLLEDVRETFNGLATKVREAIAAISQGWELGFLLKLDDDSFARLDDAFFDALQKVAAPNLYWGFLDGRAAPKVKGKWAEAGWRLSDNYLPYALGGGYVLGQALVSFIGRNRALLTAFKNEDVSVGAWLAGLDVRYEHETRFDTEYKSRGCDNRYLITHKQSPEEIREKWRRLKRHGQLCEKEFRLRKSYVYNWDVPPSQCCQRTDDPNVP